MFFFLQAEDGIRDADVTGVQTCALPIYMTSSDQMYRGSIPNSEVNVTYRLRTIAFPTRNVSGRSTSYPIVNSSSPNAWRSEERRVGKEGRSRWSPYHLKKKKKNERATRD